MFAGFIAQKAKQTTNRAKKMTVVKKTQTEKRSCERRTYETPIRLTHFKGNGGHWLEAQTLNHCLDGMGVKSNVHFRPGTALLIRVEHCASNGSCTCAFEGLPSICLGEVKWCREISDATPSSYDLGFKYFAPEY